MNTLGDLVPSEMEGMYKVHHPTEQTVLQMYKRCSSVHVSSLRGKRPRRFECDECQCEGNGKGSGKGSNGKDKERYVTGRHFEMWEHIATEHRGFSGTFECLHR